MRLYHVRNVYCSVPLIMALIFLLKHYRYHLTTSSIRTTRVYAPNDEAAQTVGAKMNPIIAVYAVGNFCERVERFNIELVNIRQQIWEHRGPGDWKGNAYSSATVEVLFGARDDYLEVLAAMYPHVTTVVLPWISIGVDSMWNSLTDTANLLLQIHYQWTADDVLCTLIETPGATSMRYDTTFNRTCVRNISKTFGPQSLQLIQLNGKALNPLAYWPNSGSAYPAHFYTAPPPFVFYMHVHHDAIVDVNGDVASRNLKLVLYSCGTEVSPEVPDVHTVYDEVFVIAQHWGSGVFHSMCEVLPRIALYHDFLQRNPQIRIVVPKFDGAHLSHNWYLLLDLLHVVGIEDWRVIVGPVRAKVVYQPRSTMCGTANVQESQTLSKLYRNYISRNFFPQERNRLILVRRSKSRRFAEQRGIEVVLERAARDYGLIYTLFVDNPTPSLNDTMMMFHSAVMIVAPVGAGESNIFFSQPGTFIVEGVCNLPHVNLCFLRLAHILGHHWHGILSRGGCEDVIDVSTASIEDAVRRYLDLWKIGNIS